ncbi:hypothetical protein Leryth_015669 [Lithospermum erythrorhizon]|nr:hypothetical protein Leryth_015669 [Lithospermum erythrorhizon]
MKTTLRSKGYTLFCNAISTSDLQLQFLSSSAVDFPTVDSSNFTDYYTIFAATDPYVYALDMASDAAAYVSTLKYHVIPNRRLVHAELRNLTTSFLETLLPQYSIFVNDNNRSVEQNDFILGDLMSGDLDDGVWVDGVRVSDPDVYVGSRIVVHGIDGILVTGIVKNEDLEDDERRLGLISTPPEAAPVVAPAAAPMVLVCLRSIPMVAPTGSRMTPLLRTGYGRTRVAGTGSMRNKKRHHNHHRRRHHSRRNWNPYRSRHNQKEDL